MEKELSLEEKWENATLANGFLFYKVMRSHPEACKKMIEILLHLEVEKLEVISEEETILIDKDAKSIRLDLYVKNESHLFDIEVQVKDTDELPERARYYQSAMDVDSLKHSQLYCELKTSHVIFICKTDIFKQGLPVYTFENFCKQDKNIELKDRAYKHFFIIDNCDKIIRDNELRAFLNLFRANKSSTSFTKDLKEFVDLAKKNTQWKRQYMTVERFQKYAQRERIAIGLAEGREEGIQQKALETAKNFIKMNILKDEQIALGTGLSLEQVQQIKEELKAENFATVQ